MRKSAHILVAFVLALVVLALALVIAGPASAVSHPCGSSDTPSEKRADVDGEGPSPIVIYVLEAKGSG